MTGELIPTGVTFGVGRNSINDAFSGTAEFNNISLDTGGDFSGGTGAGVIYSGGTDLYSIFATSGSDTNFANTNLAFNTSRSHTIDPSITFEWAENIYTSGPFLFMGGSSSGDDYLFLGYDNNYYEVEPAFLALNLSGQSRVQVSSTETVVNNVGGNYNFRVEGDTDANLIFADAGNDTVGIGGAPGAYKLDVSGSLNADGPIYSGGTDLYSIFTTSDSTTASNGLTKTGDNITLGGTLTAATTINLDLTASLNIVKTGGTGAVFATSDGASLNSGLQPGVITLGDSTASIGMSMDISQSGISYNDTFIGGGTQILKFIAPSSLTTETISLPQDKSGIVALTSDVISGSGGTATEDFIYDLGSAYQYKISGDSGSPEQITLESNFISSDPTRLTVGRSITEMISSSGASVQARIKVESGVPYMIKTAGGATQQFSFQSVGNQMKIIDGINQTGLEYDGNYHGNYTNRTLVDYEYVNNHVASATTGGGVSIDPYNDLGDVASSFTWNVSGDSTNYEVTLTAATTTVNLTNVRNGEYGTIIVNQDTTGGRAITFGTVNGGGATHIVVNGGGGSATLTSNPSAIDVLTFTYNGSKMLWSVGNDYT